MKLDPTTLLLFFLAICCNSSSVSKLNVHGLITAVLTPFDTSGRLNLSVVEQQAKFLNATGVHYVFIAGTTGESVSLSSSERMQLLTQWIKVVPKYGQKIIFHVGMNNVMEARALAEQASKLPIQAIASMPPSFFKPNNVNALVATMKYIADGAPNLPFYYYHIPSMSNVDFSMIDFVKAADGVINNLAGVKDTGLFVYPGLQDIAEILAYKNGKYEVFDGRDELMVEALATGCTGFVGSQYNFAGEIYNEVIKAYNQGNLAKARAMRLKGVELLHVEKDPLFAPYNGVKEIMNFAGVNVGESRLPMMPMPMDVKKQYCTKLKKWCEVTDDVVSWCANVRTMQHLEL